LIFNNLNESIANCAALSYSPFVYQFLSNAGDRFGILMN